MQLTKQLMQVTMQRMLLIRQLRQQMLQQSLLRMLLLRLN
jgi:hypothetical protein